MKKEELKQFVREMAQKDSRKLPALIIGDGVRDFLRFYKWPIKMINTREEMIELVSYFTGVSKLDYPLVIGDLSFYRPDDVFFLLKFIEESKLNIILLSKFDNISPIVLSRIKTVIKYNSFEEVGSSEDMQKAREFVESKTVENTSEFDKVRLQRSVNASLYMNDRRFPFSANRSKLVSILETPKGGF